MRGWWSCDPFYPFFMYDLMTKLRLRSYSRLRAVKTCGLQETLTASKVLNAEHLNEPYAQYGTKVPRVVPGTRQHWKSFCLDLTAFVEQRGFPDFFLTLSANDGWPQVQATLAKGWGSNATESEMMDLVLYNNIMYLKMEQCPTYRLWNQSNHLKITFTPISRCIYTNSSHTCTHPYPPTPTD